MQEKTICNNNPNLKGLSVLVIEDAPASLNEIENALKDIGARVYTARDSGGAAGVLLRKHIHVIMAALDLVNEQCIEMVKDYKTRYPETLFYVLTGHEYDSVEWMTM
jgi:DNA-binding NtrC family response regulator